MNAVREQEEGSKVLKAHFTATKIFGHCVISYSCYASNNLYLGILLFDEPVTNS